MISLQCPSVVDGMRDMAYGWQPARFRDSGRYCLMMKTSKEMILTARLNQEVKVYLIPNDKIENGFHGLITAFFDDHDEPLVIFTPLHDGDAMLTDMTAALAQGNFDLYFFDEHNRELMGVQAAMEGVERFRAATASGIFSPLDFDLSLARIKAMQDWFGLRTPTDDANAFTVKFRNKLYPDDVIRIDGSDEAYDFHGSGDVPEVVSIERLNAGESQERDVAKVMRRVFAGDEVFLNPMRVDTGLELCDVLCVNDDFVVVIQAKDSPNTEASLRRNIDRKRASIRKHIGKGADQLRGAIKHVRKGPILQIKTADGPVSIGVADKEIVGIIIVREMFDDDYKACSEPVLPLMLEFRCACALFDYPALHAIAQRLPDSERFISAVFQLCEYAQAQGEFAKPVFSRPSDAVMDEFLE